MNLFVIFNRNIEVWLIKLFLLLICFLTAPQSSEASLIIAIYHKEAMFIASDSAVSSVETGKRLGTVNKIFRISENCCVAITGTAIFQIYAASGKPFASRDFTKKLEELSASQIIKPASLAQKMDNVATDLNSAYCLLRTNGWVKLGETGKVDPAKLLFAGYDPRKECFFINDCIIDGINDVHVKAVKVFTGSSDTNRICLQGQAEFLTALLSGEKPELLNLISEETTRIAARLDSDKKVSDDDVVRFILELFQLHEKYAFSYGFTKSNESVGSPYSIFKILKNNVLDLSRAPKNDLLESSVSTSQSDSTDDEAIDRAMARLERTMKINDYSYVFEVMYAPILEKMGGKDQGNLAVQAIAAQMKQQQIVMVSWKATKPYQYVQGKSRSYAIIPYESVMTIAGKKISQKSYQLGIKLVGSGWQFVNGDSLTPEVFQEFFQDFPRSVSLPKLERVLE